MKSPRRPDLLLSIPALTLLALPVLVLAVRGFDQQGWRNISGSGIADAINLSLTTTLISVALALLIGTPLALTLGRRDFRGKRLINTLVELPIVLPPAVAGLALLLTFGRRGFLGPALSTVNITLPFSPGAVIIAQLFVAAPFYIRSAAVGFRGVSTEIEDAARVDGADGWTLFRFIVMPLAGRALSAGAVLCWARALGEFGATIMFAGSLPGRTQTMPLLVYATFERNLDAAIWAGLILVAVALIALLASQWLLRADEGL